MEQKIFGMNKKYTGSKQPDFSNSNKPIHHIHVSSCRLIPYTNVT